MLVACRSKPDQPSEVIWTLWPRHLKPEDPTLQYGSFFFFFSYWLLITHWQLLSRDLSARSHETFTLKPPVVMKPIALLSFPRWEIPKPLPQGWNTTMSRIGLCEIEMQKRKSLKKGSDYLGRKTKKPSCQFTRLNCGHFSKVLLSINC